MSYWTRRGAQIEFGQVREDTALERSLSRGDCLCIASGGETAFDLLTGGADSVLAIDLNPAQIWLVELKAAVLRQLPWELAVEAMTQDARPAFSLVGDDLSPEARSHFASNPNTLTNGLQNSGRVDRLLARLARLFQRLVHPRERVERLLSQPDLVSQRALYDAEWNTARWRLGLQLLCNRATLRLLFGSSAVRELSAEAVATFAREIETVLRDVEANSNPYAWQAMLGTYPPQVLPDWLSKDGFDLLVSRLDRLELRVGDLWSTLEFNERTFDTVCLSNILDVTNKRYPGMLMEVLPKRSSKGAIVVGRSFFPGKLKLVERGQGALTCKEVPNWTDRSFFCRNVEIAEVDSPSS